MDVQESGLQESKQRWRSAVAGVLAKSTRRDPADLPPEPERLLDSPTYEGFPIRALYTSLDALPEPPLPGDWPFVRGGDALRDVKSGWKVAEAFPVAGQKAVTDGNGAVLVALTEGVSALVLRVGAPDGVAAGRAGPPARGCVPRPRAGGPRRRCGFRCRRRGGAAAAGRHGRRPARPAVDRPRRRPAHRAVERASRPRTSPTSSRPRRRSRATPVACERITVDGPALHNLGASASWELAGAVAAGVAYLRLLGEAGLERAGLVAADQLPAGR